MAGGHYGPPGVSHGGYQQVQQSYSQQYSSGGYPPPGASHGYYPQPNAGGTGSYPQQQQPGYGQYMQQPSHYPPQQSHNATGGYPPQSAGGGYHPGAHQMGMSAQGHQPDTTSGYGTAPAPQTNTTQNYHAYSHSQYGPGAGGGRGTEHGSRPGPPGLGRGAPQSAPPSRADHSTREPPSSRDRDRRRKSRFDQRNENNEHSPAYKGREDRDRRSDRHRRRRSRSRDRGGDRYRRDSRSSRESRDSRGSRFGRSGGRDRDEPSRGGASRAGERDKFGPGASRRGGGRGRGRGGKREKLPLENSTFMGPSAGGSVRTSFPPLKPLPKSTAPTNGGGAKPADAPKPFKFVPGASGANSFVNPARMRRMQGRF